MQDLPLHDWLTHLEQLSQPRCMSRKHERTTINIDNLSLDLLKRLHHLFGTDSDWKTVNYLLTECLIAIATEQPLPESPLIRHLQFQTNPRLMLFEGERNAIAIHKGTRAIWDWLKTYSGCKSTWQTFNFALMHGIARNERWLAVCSDVFEQEEGVAA